MVRQACIELWFEVFNVRRLSERFFCVVSFGHHNIELECERGKNEKSKSFFQYF